MRRTIRPRDEEWPSRLSEIAPLDPPERLRVDGLPLPNDAPSIAVVGTRTPTGVGIEIATTLSRAFAEAGFTVVSGLAVGIDAVAHRAALEAGGHTVAVLGGGLNIVYPKANRDLRREIEERGAVVTEYDDDTAPTKFTFPRRNRIIAGLAQAVVVVEGAITSGALVTARLALDANRSVYAVPGSSRNPMAAGPNELIRTGRAALVTSPSHVFEDLAPSLVWEEANDQPSVADIGVTELTVLRALDDTASSTDRLGLLTGLKLGELAVTLSRLEVRSLARRTYGGYELTTAGARVRSSS
ncbi:MAG: DNA-processing protein DprA [Actinomycetota bacterium]